MPYQQATISLGGPWKNRAPEKVKAAWGIPATMDDLPLLVHLSRGGWNAFALPPLPAVYAYATKAAKHADAAHYLNLLAEAALFSQYPLSEATAVIGHLMDVDFRKDQHPQHWANDWAMVVIAVANARDARRRHPEALGTVSVVEQFIAEASMATGLADSTGGRSAGRGVSPSGAICVGR